MWYIERKNLKPTHIIALLLAAAFLFVGLIAGRSSAGNSAAYAEMQTMTAPQLESVSQDMPLVSFAASTTTEKMYVYDESENKLMYNRVTGMVFSEVGVVYNQDSQPLTYDDDKQVFEDSIQRRLDLVERSTGGLQNYYLMFGNYKVRSIGIDDELYIARMAAKTAFNSGDAYDMLVTRVYVQNPWYMWLIGQYGHYEYYDLHGHEIDDKYFDKKYRPNLMAGAGTSAFGGYTFVKFEKWGTIRDLLDEIIFLMEIVPPNGSPMGEFALNTATGAFLRDDRNQKIRIHTDGYLIDPMGWPLIGADARPVYWREDIYAYVDYKEQLLEFGENNVLCDSNGFIVHSVISNVIAGLRIYLIYLSDGKTLIPATGKTISTDPFVMEWYDMNGNLISEEDIIPPEVSEDDRKNNWPEEFDLTWLEELQQFFKNIGKWFSDNGNTIVTVVIIIVVVIAACLILGLLGPVWPILGMAFQAVGKGIGKAFQFLAKGIAKVFQYLAYGIAAIVTAPIKLIKYLTSKGGGE